MSIRSIALKGATEAMDFFSWAWFVVIDLGIALLALGGLIALVERMKERDNKL